MYICLNFGHVTVHIGSVTGIVPFEWKTIAFWQKETALNRQFDVRKPGKDNRLLKQRIVHSDTVVVARCLFYIYCLVTKIISNYPKHFGGLAFLSCYAKSIQVECDYLFENHYNFIPPETTSPKGRKE